MSYRIAAITTLIFLSTSAQADLILRLDDGAGNNVEIFDNMAGDMSSALGEITFIGMLGGFTTNVSTGISAPALGTLDDPRLHLTSVQVSGVGTMTISLSATGFMNPIGNRLLHFLMVGGVAAGTVVVDAFADSTNAAFGMNTALGGVSGPASGGPFAASDRGVVSIVAAPYSLSLFATINHDRPGSVTSFDADLRIPEPGTIGIFGFGLLLLGFARKVIPVKAK